jgi:tetratricopeptide (TPR) repeat protein
LAAIAAWQDAAEQLSRVEEDDRLADALRTEVGARLQAAQSTLAVYVQAASRLTPADREAIKSAVLDAEGHYELAAQLAWAAVDRYPGVAGPWRAAGIAETHLGHLSEFVESGLPDDLATDPAAAWMEFAKFLAQVSEWAAADRLLQQALGMTEFDASMETGAIAREMGRIPMAMSYYQRASRLDATRPDPYIEIARIAIGAQQREAAAEAIANAAERGAPDDVIESLRAQAGVGATDVEGLRRTIIQ